MRRANDLFVATLAERNIASEILVQMPKDDQVQRALVPT